jgi:hypothetical protein
MLYGGTEMEKEIVIKRKSGETIQDLLKRVQKRLEEESQGKVVPACGLKWIVSAKEGD